MLRLRSPDTVLAGLTAIANDWRWLAVTWHVLLAVSVVLFLAGWWPSVRLFGCLLVAPLLSVRCETVVSIGRPAKSLGDGGTRTRKRRSR